MRIDFVEIANFRKLLAVRIDLSEKTTLLVGANNSGKTSAMLALRYFLTDSGPSRFCLNDFTLCHWATVNEIGEKWRAGKAQGDTADFETSRWHEIVPCLDLWFKVENGEIHRVSKLIPTLDWAGGRLGIRLRFEPKDPEALWKTFLAAVESIEKLKAQTATGGEPAPVPPLWPKNLAAFLDNRQQLKSNFEVRAYALDPDKVLEPEKGIARLQALAPDTEPIDAVSLKGLIRIDEINAQRVFGDESDSGDGLKPEVSGARQLSRQLRRYYSEHLDPLKDPDPADLKALEAIELAQSAFDQRLAISFKEALDEVQGLGYPGVTDPKITISTLLKPVEGLDHDTAVQYEIESKGVSEGEVSPVLRLPEFFNGLGYQNLVSMIFRLMSFRDAWLRVGKAGKGKALDSEIPPVHLVLVEEPEAHLHVQVQQVFIRKAYDVLRKHADLGKKLTLQTQLVVSTHSSHVAHEVEFASLRYFRRLPAGKKALVPVSTVVNLSEVFGTENDTKRFVTRYLKAQHCDLFFADAAILLEGPAERMLIPHFISQKFKRLDERYITMLEIGGSHAHRLKPLIEHLQLPTLIITDLDSLNGASGAAEQPQRGSGQKTNNDTLKSWVPKLESIDELCALVSSEKIVPGDDELFGIRVSYQIPQTIALRDLAPEEVVPYTFEDALVFENLTFFAALQGKGLVRKFRDAIANSPSPKALGSDMFAELRSGKKAEFALDVINAQQFESLQVPTYIAEGLTWLQSRLVKEESAATPSTATPGTSV